MLRPNVGAPLSGSLAQKNFREEPRDRQTGAIIGPGDCCWVRPTRHKRGARDSIRDGAKPICATIAVLAKDGAGAIAPPRSAETRTVRTVSLADDRPSLPALAVESA